MPPPRILIVLPAGPVAAWRVRAIDALRRAGAAVRTARVAHAAAEPSPGGLPAAVIFALERHWSSALPTGLEPDVAPEDDFAGEPDIRLSLAGDGALTGPTAAGGDWCIGFPDTHDPASAARRAVLEGREATTVRLRIRDADGTRRVRESVCGVNAFSATDTLRTTLAIAAALPAREMRAPGRAAAPAAPARTGERRGGAWRHLGRLVREGWRDLTTRKQWYLLVGDNLDLSPEPARLKAVHPPGDRIWADPFVVEDPSGAWVFFEEMLFSEKRGRIAVGRLTGQTLTEVRTVLATDHHLSYPQVFRHDGKLRMTVESAQAGGVRVYESRQFPDRWVPGPVIFDGPMLDPSLFQYAGRWWLFGHLPPGPGAKADGELSVFFADDPMTGRWTPHPLNPVVSDARCGRGAGRPYVHNGRLYRPSQDCAGGYGRRVILQEITTLSPTDYAERPVATLSPESLPGAVALHTLNPGRAHVAADAARRLPRR